MEILEDRTVPAGGVTEFGIGITGNPGGIVLNEVDGKFYFDEQFQDTIGMFDLATGISVEFPSSVTGIPPGFKPHNMKFVPPGQPGSQFGNIVFTGLGTDPAGNGPGQPFQPPNVGGLCFFDTVTHHATIFTDGVTLLPGGVAPALHDSTFDSVDGNYWITEQIASRIAKFDPNTQTFQEFSLAAPGVAVEPHGILVAHGLPGIADGNLVFAAHAINKIQVFDINTHAVTDLVTGITPGAFPHDPLIGDDGKLYFTEVFGGNVGQFDLTTHTLKEFPIPGLPRGVPQGVTLTKGPDGHSVWFVEFLASRIGKFDFTTQTITNFRIGITPHSNPLVIINALGNIWFSEAFAPPPGTHTTGRLARLIPAEADLDIQNPNRGFVETVFNDILHRDPTPGELAVLTHRLDQATRTSYQSALARFQIVKSIITSLEGRIAAVQGEFFRLLHHPADPASLNEFVAFLLHGGSLAEVAARIIGSPEYFAIHGGTNDGFLAGLFQDMLNKPIDSGSLNRFEQRLAHGVSRLAVARTVIFSPAGAASAIAGLYGRFLFRSADEKTRRVLAAALLQGVSLNTIQASIMASAEYFRFRLFAADPPFSIPGVLEV